MADYTVEQILAAAAQAEEAGQPEKAAELRKIAARRGAPEDKPKRRERKAAISGNLARTLAQGALFGAYDEVEAFLRSRFSDEEYGDALNSVRTEMELYAKDNPTLAMGAEIAGGFLTPMGVIGGTGKAGLTAARTLKGVAARGATAGAAGGGVAGFAHGEGGFAERAKGAGVGALAGGALGAAAPVALGFAGDVGSRVFDGLGLTGQKRAATLAERRVIKALEREGLTPEDALARMQRGSELGADILPADLGENLAGAAYVAQAVPHARRSAVRGILDERGIEQGGRIAGRVSEALDSAGEFGLDYLDDIAAAAKAKYRPLYQAADKPISAAPFRKYADRSAFKTAYGRAQRAADDIGDPPLPPLDELLSGDTVSTMHLQQIAQGLDEVIEAGTDKLTGKMSTSAVRLKGVRDEFKEAIGDLNADYKAADSQFRGYMDLRRAYDVGNKFEKLSGQVLSRKIGKMTVEEVEALKVGMVTKIRDIGSGSDRVDYYQRIFGSPKRRDALRNAMGDESFTEFSEYMALERDMVRTSRRVLGGSDTARNIMEQGEQGIDPSSLLQMIAGGKGEVVRQAAGALGTRMRGVGAPVAEQMSDLLYAQGRSAQKTAMDRLTRRAAEDAANRQGLLYRPELYGAAGGGILGSRQEDFR